jgi:ABC-type multidrug transport system fused ATPase/permease subunit
MNNAAAPGDVGRHSDQTDGERDCDQACEQVLVFARIAPGDIQGEDLPCSPVSAARHLSEELQPSGAGSVFVTLTAIPAGIRPLSGFGSFYGCFLIGQGLVKICVQSFPCPLGGDHRTDALQQSDPTAPIVGLASTPLVIAGSSPGMRQIRNILDIPRPGRPPAQLSELAGCPVPASLRLRDVTFSYAGSTKSVFTGLTFEIPAGALVGITGRSGCGKSTLGKLLNGDLVPPGGVILVDGVDVAQWPLVWKRELIGFLPTGFEFLNGTLEENVLIGRERSNIDHFDDALRLSGVTKFLEEESLTLQHPIRSLSGEGYLSFGQRRRVGIAQLLCGKQRILILDEPGSSLDPQTMLAVAANLREAVRGRTTLIITHDPDIFQTDFNLFIKNGVIADIGPHSDLMRRNPDYFDLLNKNMKERTERAQTVERH